MSNELATISDPIQLLARAVEKGGDVEQLRELMALKKEYEADIARKAFFKAVKEFKSVPITILKDMVNKQYDSRYTSKGNLVNTVNAELSKHGLTANWGIAQKESTISVTCNLSHEMGHTEGVTLSGPPDTSGSKNPLQQIKSTLTYLEIATFEAVVGVAPSNIGNDDGNGAAAKLITEAQAADLTALMDECVKNKAKFLEWLQVEKIADLPADKYARAVAECEKKRKAA